jgi:hypothetical protein
MEDFDAAAGLESLATACDGPEEDGALEGSLLASAPLIEEAACADLRGWAPVRCHSGSSPSARGWVGSQAPATPPTGG